MNLLEVKENMHKMALELREFTYPNLSQQEEEDSRWLKTRYVFVDGYYLAIFFSISDTENINVTTLQIFSIYSPYLPFHLVCKIAQIFLGKKYLNFMSISANDKTIYCWHVYKKDGQKVAVFNKNKIKYQDFEYWNLSE